MALSAPDSQLVSQTDRAIAVRHLRKHYSNLEVILQPGNWPRGINDLHMTVERDGQTVELAFTPWTIGLHPTQIYESISTGLLLFVLLAYYPLRRHDGAVMVLLMLGYSVHRFINESLRNDTDPVAFNLTLSQNISLLLFGAGLLMGLWIWSRPPQYGPGAPRPEEIEKKPAEDNPNTEPAKEGTSENALQD